MIHATGFRARPAYRRAILADRYEAAARIVDTYPSADADRATFDAWAKARYAANRAEVDAQARKEGR